MPCIKRGNYWQIRRSKGGLYPKKYTSLSVCKERVAQMEKFKHLRKKGQKK